MNLMLDRKQRNGRITAELCTKLLDMGHMEGCRLYVTNIYISPNGGIETPLESDSCESQIHVTEIYQPKWRYRNTVRVRFAMTRQSSDTRSALCEQTNIHI